MNLDMHKICGIKKRRSWIERLFMTAVLQHYPSVDDEIREPFLVCSTLGLSSGTRTINSSSLQFRASHIRSKCFKFTLSTNSWYNSLIVFGRMPVALAKSACVHLSSPSLVDSKILIIHCRSFPYKIPFFNTSMCLLLFYSGLGYILSNYDKQSGFRFSLMSSHSHHQGQSIHLFSLHKI